MKYEIKGGSFPVVICNLENGEKMITERGSMCWMSPNMQMETKGGGLGKMFSAVTQHFTFGVQHHIAAVGVHKVRLGIEPGFTCTGTAANQYIQVAPVFSAIHTNRHILG